MMESNFFIEQNVPIKDHFHKSLALNEFTKTTNILPNDMLIVGVGLVLGFCGVVREQKAKT